ncbi:MAG TPA: cupin domain-containing protein [Pyrinomonadaceae bacterium]|nr:cupin domain-containing protein [Pyrinomonadaceae bacterium]
MSLPPIIVDDLDRAIDRYVKELGFRLEMIKPADAPREALLSEPPAVAGGLTSQELRFITLRSNKARLQPPATAGGSDWVRGRAGMEYRDLVPNRLGGKVIASHIRLTEGGEVPDYVHYHKIALQIIYCLKGRIKVVYEDQGPPFWLEAGDCVLQPPEIRHRVLECEAGSEVIEVTSPAEHETWVEHEITLPTAHFKPDRDFGGQRFVRRNAAANASGHLGIAAVTGARFDAGISSDVTGQRSLWVKLADGERLSIDL